MPRAIASFISGGSSGNIAMHPLTWNPPIATFIPAARNSVAISTARAN